MRYSRPFVVVALLVGFGFPSLASGQDVAPPGNSAVEQYRESAPPPSGGSKKLSSAQRKSLEKQGSDGAALAGALDRSGGLPDVSSAGSDASGNAGAERAAAAGTGGDSRRGAAAPAQVSSNPLSEDESASRGSASRESASRAAVAATVGPFPIWVMILGALTVVAVGLLVRRRSAV